MPSRDALPFRFERVDYSDPRAVALRAVMDDELGARYSVDGEPIDALTLTALAVNPSDVRATVLVIDHDGTPIAHAALRMLRGDWEVKRVIVTGDQRGRGIGRALMLELERIASEEGAARLILQTGDRQPEAVALYEKIGFTPIALYEPYATAIPFSLCFEKSLR
ncbi:GNAT family N-acetyltransferase [Subtercola sp. PAMC28395]|uniref:GNAT family N-acetyltransferase n=1 Tax=Subtercola sp. PAMC28395 TaxID=2846775 RepID=UPI001C0C8806|nr:GNAT family N-acetyltransferase [Subtercola sp. PAMC28395]QWT24441.1 GNAT family N-acetyltransferase [Subtercola sp. PAMC28395]